MVTCGFFRARSLDDLVLDCYRLAKYYHISPAEFLRMPLSELNLHRKWTGKLIELTEPPEDDDG